MIRSFYYSIRNFLFHRTVTDTDATHLLDDLKWTSGMDEIKKVLTEYMLLGWGLTISEDGIPFCVFLTKGQKEVIELVRPYGYNVGLRQKY